MRLTSVVLTLTLGLITPALALTPIKPATVTAKAQSATVTPSSLTGLQVLQNLAKAQGVALSSAEVNAIRTTPNAYLKTAAAGQLREDLRVSPDVFASLIRSASVPVSAELATQAVLQAVSGQDLVAGSVAALVAQNPSLLVTSVGTLASVITDAASLANLNAVVEAAKQPVTARGGGK